MNELIRQMHNIAQEKNIKVGGVFEEVVKTSYQNIIVPNDKVIDIGAHKGFHLFPMSEAVGQNGKVYAFEPLPYLADRLKSQIKKKKLSNIKLYKCALGLKKETSTFQHFKKFPAYSGLERRNTPFDNDEGDLEVITVKQNRLDRKLPWFAKVSFIKLDIEGGELHALMGGERLLSRSRPVIVFEGGSQSSANVYHYQQEDFFGFFEKINMSVYTLVGSPFTRKEWNSPDPCWEFFAIPNENTSLVSSLPDYATQVIQSY